MQIITIVCLQQVAHAGGSCNCQLIEAKVISSSQGACMRRTDFRSSSDLAMKVPLLGD